MSSNIHKKGKYLREYVELDVELTKKKMQNNNKAVDVQPAAPPLNLLFLARIKLLENLLKEYPLMEVFVNKHPLYYIFLYSNHPTDAIVYNFFYFYHKFPLPKALKEKKNMMMLKRLLIKCWILL